MQILNRDAKLADKLTETRNMLQVLAENKTYANQTTLLDEIKVILEVVGLLRGNVERGEKTK